MAGMCEGRVAIVTGAGRGIGREYALMLAEQGAKVIVNDLGAERDGTGTDASPAQQVVDEITAMGGEAAVNGADVSDFDAASQMIAQAVETFGGLDVLVNNAGILRDRMLVNMTEEEWDLVVKVHLKGTFAPARFAAAYWRERSKDGHTNDARIINTTSVSGIYGNVGQTNYGAAKAGIAAMTLVAAAELERYGVRVNAIAPIARTRLTLATPGMGAIFATEVAEGEFDAFSPANISPLVAYLASEKCALTGKVFAVQGGAISELAGWHDVKVIETEGPWTIDDIAARLP
jgi:NAD(P)-dependent dehydrogenase (short-subunit alcohol dehydrogenase family)